jgi:amidohydrolase
MIMHIDKHIKDIMPEIINIRHEIHANPEPAYTEHNTAKLICNFLSRYGYIVQRRVAKTGIVGILDTCCPGPVVAIRADMDALPITETNVGLVYASKHKGYMHACGHDGHIANLLCTAVVLSQIKSQLCGKIKLIFQPAEEIGSGAFELIKAGVLDNPSVDYILGLHNWPNLPEGHIGVKDHEILIGLDTFDIQVQGKGGHSSNMSKCKDPIHAACQLKLALESIPKHLEGLTAFDSIAVTQVHGGSTYNVIPDQAILAGSFRSTSDKAREMILKNLKITCKRMAELNDIKIDVSLEKSVPPTVNTSKVAKLVYDTACDALGTSNTTWLKETCRGSEDFSYFLKKVKGCFFLVGNGNANRNLHMSCYDFNDNIIPRATKVLVNSVVALLNSKP